MSTTMSTLMVAEQLGVIAQVGDIRVYRLRNGITERLTEDHTLINYKLKHGLITPEEAERAPGKNVITRAVGHRDYVQVDTMECYVMVGDRFLLCSDGLHSYISDEEVGGFLADGAITDAVQKMVDEANARGGRDNITALAVET
ncbi:MAG: serine/threonine-protein phosphatase, partial [Cyanobacteria bacterium P01_F01_bin.13]